MDDLFCWKAFTARTISGNPSTRRPQRNHESTVKANIVAAIQGRINNALPHLNYSNFYQLA
jgi:hypothetical protein